MAVPKFEGAVNVALQTAVPNVDPWTKVHGEPEKDPETPLSAKLTAPPGVIAEPDAELSVTDTVQVEG